MAGGHQRAVASGDQPKMTVYQVHPCSPLTSHNLLGTLWSAWSITESHRKMTVRERLTVGMHHAHGRMHATERRMVNVVKE